MNADEWYQKLLLWARKDSRLHKLPYALIGPLSEHLAELEAAAQPAQGDALPGSLCCEYFRKTGYLHSEACVHYAPRR